MIARAPIPSSVLLPAGMLFISMASIQAGSALAKSMFPIVGAQGATSLRLIFASVIMTVILRPWRAKLTAKSLRTLIIYGMALGGMNLLFYMSLRTLPLGIAVSLEFTGPLSVAIYSSRRALDFLWIGIAIVGLLLLIPIWEAGNCVDLIGSTYALGAGIFWALYIIFGQKSGNDNGVQTAALGVMIAALFVAPIGIFQAGTALLTPALIPAAIGVGILSTALPYTIEMVALTRLPAHTFGILMSIEPAFGAFSGLLFLQEHLSTTQWLAISCIILSCLGAALTGSNESKTLVLAD